MQVWTRDNILTDLMFILDSHSSCLFKVFQGVLRLASVYVSLCKEGEVSHLEWRDQFHSKPLVGEERLADQLNEESNRMERCLYQWREEIHAKRMQYSHLNHYTIQQLLLLRKSLAGVHNEGLRACESLFSLLESVLPGILPSALHAALVSSGICSAQERDPLRTYEAGFTFQMSDSPGRSVSSTQSSIVTSPGSQSSAVERFRSLVSKVEQICVDVDSEMVAIAAMVACGNVGEGDLILWCFKNGTNEILVSEKYSEAQNDPRFAMLLSKLGAEPSTAEDTFESQR